MENNNILTEKIKQTVMATDASAQVLLFGSRARGDAKKDSDWDILILLNKAKVTIKDEQVFRHKLFDVELETGACISTFVYALNDWNTRMSITPLYKNVQADGIYL
jgi:predicted nucleotidyltransferase